MVVHDYPEMLESIGNRHADRLIRDIPKSNHKAARGVLTKQFSWENRKQEIAKIVLAHFSREELEETTFFESKVGTRVMEKLRDFNAGYSKIINLLVQDVEPLIEEELDALYKIK